MEIKLPKTVKQLLNEEEEEIHKQNLHESRCPHPQWNCCTGWPCTLTAPGTSHWTPLSTSPSGRLSHHGDDLHKTQKNNRVNFNLRKGKYTPVTVVIVSFRNAPGETLAFKTIAAYLVENGRWLNHHRRYTEMDFQNWVVPVTEREILQSTCRHNLPKQPRGKSYHCYQSRVWSRAQWPCRYRHSWANYFGFCWRMAAEGFLLGTLAKGEKENLKTCDPKYNPKVCVSLSDHEITYLVFAGWVEGIDNRSPSYPTGKYMKGGILNNSVEKTNWRRMKLNQ